MIEDDALNRYSRQVLVPGFEFEGQEALASARVVIVGCGGLGVVVALYLGGAGVGELILVDDDRIELSNLPRQIAFKEVDQGGLKAEVLARELRSANSQINVIPRCERLDEDNAHGFFKGATLVIDATDSMEARRLINVQTAELGLPWVMGAAVQMSGQVVAFSPNRAEGCYHCLTSLAADAPPGNCAELGVLGPVVGSIGIEQALLAIKILSGCAPVAWGHLQMIDFRNDTRQTLALTPRPGCSVCG